LKCVGQTGGKEKRKGGKEGEMEEGAEEQRREYVEGQEGDLRRCDLQADSEQAGQEEKEGAREEASEPKPTNLDL
jgi:hypothetical protein